MNTAELIEELASKSGLTKANSKTIINFITDRIATEVKKGKIVKLSGFGVFYRANRKARKGRNPQNGEPVQIPAVKVPRFKPGKRFKEAVRK